MCSNVCVDIVWMWMWLFAGERPPAVNESEGTVTVFVQVTPLFDDSPVFRKYPCVSLSAEHIIPCNTSMTALV